MIINMYLKVFQTILMGIGTMLMLVGAATCDGCLYEVAIRMLWYGLTMLVCGAICGKLREI